MKSSVIVITILIVLCFVLPPVLHAETGTPLETNVIRGAYQSDPVAPAVFDGDLRNLPKMRAPSPDEPVIEIPRRTHPRAGSDAPSAGSLPEGKADKKAPPQPVPREDAPEASSRVFTAPAFSFDGMGVMGAVPPDTVGDAGPNHYIQMVNSSGGAVFAIHDKTGSGIPVAGPTSLDTLWSGGGNCSSGGGDGIVLYDWLADRWLLAEFASSGNHLCVYVSITADPVAGGWNGYDFSVPEFPDYPKYAVWPDGYYVSSNESSPAAYALDRVNMLSGLPATFQRFTAPDLSGFLFQSLTPGDLDGATPPPAGSPAYFMRHKDAQAHGGGTDTVELFEFHVDWTTPANSTFTGPTGIAVSPFDSSLCGLSTFSCFPQPGTGTTLDPLREVIMWRLAYRNFGDHESLAGNFVTDVGSDRGGIRWFEFRRTDPGPWTLFQEGTYAPADGASRWMGSIAMDGAGDIALGYSITSGSIFPSIRYTGRLNSDPPGTMPRGEGSLVAGGGSQTGTNRWGDYSALSVDPADDCTFWYTNEYYSSSSSSSWKTRIGAFSFGGCGASDLSLSKLDSPDPVVAGTTLTYTVMVDNSGPDDATGVTVTDTLPGGVTFVTAVPDPGSCDQDSGVITCSLGDIADGNSATVTIEVIPDASGFITNSAVVNGDQNDPDTDNNTASAGTTVNAEIDLSMAKTGPGSAYRDDPVTYTLTVANAGPSNATGVTATDDLPGSVSFVSATPDQGSCGEAGGIVTCNIGDMDSGVSLDIEVVVIPTSEDTLVNNASVSGDQPDTNSGNDTDSAITSVSAVADLAIVKTDSPDPVVAGNPLTYTVTVTNNGPSTATGVELTDTLPGSVTFDSATPPCAGGVAPCSLGILSSGDSVTVEIEVTPLSSGTIGNTASASGTETDLVPGNDSDGENTSVTGISASPASHFFGYVEPGNVSPVQSFTITDSGTTGLDIGTLILSGGDPSQFGIPTDNCSGQSLPPSGTCTLEAYFSPSTAGPRTTNIQVPSTDPVFPTLNITLSGTQLRTVSVTKIGNGTGTIESFPGGIICGSTCQASVPSGTQVALTAIPDSNSNFTFWSGDADCTDGTVTVDKSLTCTAEFTLKTFPLTVTLSGGGTGTVRSDPVEINCGTDCEHSYDYGTQVMLNADPDDDSVFTGWGGDCSGQSADTSITITRAENCTASLELKTYTLSITLEGPGSGTVTSTPGGIDCGADCTGTFSFGEVVRLSPVPDGGSSFAGWTGDLECSEGEVTLKRDTDCTAVFSEFGDLDGSGRVDGFDLGRLGMAFDSTPSDPGWNPEADLNGDSVVDELDIDILLNNFGLKK